MTDPIGSFLSLATFSALWDGPPLNTAQQQVVPLLLQVASNWILARVPTLPMNDPAGQLVTFEVTANALRYGKYAPLRNWSRTTMHKMDSGTLDDPSSALDFTDRHKQMLGIALRSQPIGQFADNDFVDPTFSGWPTPYSLGMGTNPYVYGESSGNND